jgi:hypothetical protein
MPELRALPWASMRRRFQRRNTKMFFSNLITINPQFRTSVARTGIFEMAWLC